MLRKHESKMRIRSYFLVRNYSSFQRHRFICLARLIRTGNKPRFFLKLIKKTFSISQRKAVINITSIFIPKTVLFS